MKNLIARALLLTSAASVLAGANVGTQETGTEVCTPASNLGPASTKLWASVPEVAWHVHDIGSAGQFISKIAEQRHPFIFRGAVPNNWAARTAWAPQSLAARFPELQAQVQWSKNRYFMFYDLPSDQVDENELLPDTAATSEFANDLGRAPLAAFVQNLTAPSTAASEKLSENFTASRDCDYGAQNGGKSSRRYGRLTGLLSGGGSLSPLLPDVEPFSDLLVLDPGADVGPPMLSFWMGGVNVTTHTHYDVDHNVFAQCVPFARIILLLSFG
eukprot:SAG31_NODE_932_length_10913_cov_3.933235_13_plen_272_part_00